MHNPAADPRTTASLIWILSASGFASTFAGRCIEPLVGVIAHDLAADIGTIALLSAAFTLPYAFIQPILGPFGDAVGKALVMRACLGVLVAALVASALAPNPATLFVLRIVAGAAAGGIIPLALAMIGDRVDMARRQVAISRFVIAVILGQLSGSSVSGFLAESIGWRGVFVLAAGIAILAGLLTLMLRRVSARAPFSVRAAAERYRAILRLPLARALYLFVFFEALTIFGIFPYIAPLLEARGAGGPSEAGLALGGFALGGLVYVALVTWMLRTLGLGLMLIGGGAVAALALVGLGFAGSWRMDAMAMLMLGLGFYMLHNSYQTQVTEVAPEARASAVAIHAFSFFCGQALGVVLVGRGLSAIGQAGTLAACALVILAVGAASAWIIAGRPRAG